MKSIDELRAGFRHLTHDAAMRRIRAWASAGRCETELVDLTGWSLDAIRRVLGKLEQPNELDVIRLVQVLAANGLNEAEISTRAGIPINDVRRALAEQPA